MRLLRFIPIKLTLCLIFGILSGRFFEPNITYALALTLISLAFLAWFFVTGNRRKSVPFGISVIATVLSIGILSVTLASPENHKSHYSHHISDQYIFCRLKIQEIMKPTAFSTRYIAKIQHLENRPTTEKVLLSFITDSMAATFQVDDELLAYGQLEGIAPPLNPHQFNYKKYLKGLGISNQLRLSVSDIIALENPSRTIKGTASAFRNKIISKLRSANFEEEQLSIIQALLLGQRNDISEDTYNNYKNAGAVHILAVSGLHIGLLLLLLQFLLKPLEYLPKGKVIKLAVIVFLLWGFAFLAGLSASIVRAVTMFTFVAYAMYLNRPGNTFNILALSMFFILLVVNPFLIFQVGFQMSYAAVFAIVWIYPLSQKLWYPKNWPVRKVWQLLSVSVAAQLGVLPISLFYFHQFPGLFFISNLLIVPFLGLILGLGILVIVLGLLNILPEILVNTYDQLIGLMNDTVGWVARQEAFIFQNIPFDRVQLVLAYAMIFGLILTFTKATFRRIAFLLTSCILFQLWILYASYQTTQTTRLLLAHQTQNSVLMHQEGSRLSILTNDSTRTMRLATDYQVAERITSLHYQNLKNSYVFQDKKLLIIDSLGIYPDHNKSVDYLILTQSPKINLERLIDSLRPEAIIVDGSNYKSYIARWKNTCHKRKLPFHYTGEKRAYYFEH